MTTAIPEPPLDPSCDTPAEELANALTHGIGLALALLGTAVGCAAAAATGSVLRLVTVGVFSLALVMLFLASTGFHLARDPRVRQRWRLFDHICIYALIAGTYTPVSLVLLGGTWGWALFSITWTLAVIGIGAKVVLVGRRSRFARMDTLLYLAMGWVGLLAAGPIWASLSATGLLWLILGGVAYSAGCIFFLWNTLPFNHAIWHGFVLLGSACHYFLILLHAVPVPT